MPAERPRAVLAAVAVSCLAFLFYACLIGRGFAYDDFLVIKQERPLASAGDLARIFRERHYAFRPYYRPVTRLTFAAQKTLHGDESARPYHAVNALLAGALALTAWRLFRIPAFGLDALSAAGGALLLALHPIAASCVFPAASGRETLLPTVLMLASLEQHLRGGRGQRLRAGILFTLALFSKESAVVLLPLFLLVDLSSLSGGPRAELRPLVARYALLAVPLVLYLAVRWSIFRGGELALQDDARYFLMTPVYALQTALVPFWDPVYEPVAFEDWVAPFRLAGVGLILALAAHALRSRRPERRTFAFWGALFVLGLLPTANVLRQDAPYCERYVLLALVALIGMACQLSSPRQRPLRHGSSPALRRLFALAALAACAACSVHYAAVYSSNLSFCEQWARSSPGYYLAHYNLGRAQEDAGLDGAAQESYERSLELNAGWASSHANLGALLLRSGRPEDALRAFERWRELAPDSARAHYGVGVAQLQLGHADAALGPLARAVELDPGSAEAHHNLGVACARSGDLEQARRHLEEALRIDPGKENSRQSLELVLEQLAGE